MKNKIIEKKVIEILKKYDNPRSWWRGISPLKYQEVAKEIIELMEPRCGYCRHIIQWCNCTDWAGIDPVKWKDVKPSRKYIIFGDAEDITITP